MVDIPNAIQGKYYILIITNYSNQPCNIIFSQTGGSGVTDCTILPPAAVNNGPLCVGETLHLSAANMNNAVYHWTGPGGWASNSQNPIRPNVQLPMAGIYSLYVTINGVPSADTNHTNVQIFNKPTAVLTGGGEICAGDSSKLTINCQNQPPWVVTYTKNGVNPTNITINNSPYYFWVKPTVNTTYALSQVVNEICTGTASGNASIIVNPKPSANFTFNNNCSGNPTQFTDISSVTGGYATAWRWNFGLSGDTSNLQNPTYTYANGGTYNVVFRVTTNKGCKDQLLKPVLINPTPAANAGPDKTIGYGTSTTLQGGASGGSGTYSSHWEPANQLVNPNILNPTTVNMAATTDFTLTVTDVGNTCQHSDVATVTVTGGALAVTVQAEPPAICKGSNSVINLQPGGGSGMYTYSWSSSPAGFTSTLEDITVQPLVTTTYTVLVNDGFSIVSKSITITVYENPLVEAGSNQTIPFGTTTFLNGYATAGVQPYTYSWSPANLLVSPTQSSTSTHILSSTTNFVLTVKDGHGCVSTDPILVTITGGALMVHPEATKSPICSGENTTLLPLSEGGSGNYSYTWTTNSGFSSNEANPMVSPTSTTTYHLVISDGFTTSTGDVVVTVNPLPFINLIPAGAHVISSDSIYACVFDTVTLKAFNPNSTYLWSNGATSPEIKSTTTGIAFDLLTYSVDVSNTLTGCSNSGILTIMYTYSECSYGVAEQPDAITVMLYPNPGKGLYTCRVQTDFREIKMEIFNSQGTLVSKDKVSVASGNTHDFSVDITNQPSGIYFLKLYNNDFLKVVKIVKY